MEEYWSTQARLSIGKSSEFQTEFSSAKEKSVTDAVTGFACVPPQSCILRMFCIHTHYYILGVFFRVLALDQENTFICPLMSDEVLAWWTAII